MANVTINQIVSPAELEAIELEEQLQETSEQTLTASRRRRAELQKKAGPRITELEIQEESWYLARLNFAEQLIVGFLTARNDKNEIDLGCADILASFAAALLFVVCVRGEDDEEPFFESRDEAQQWVDDPACDGVVTSLFNAALLLNPRLMANVKRPKAPTVATKTKATATMDWRTMMTESKPATETKTTGDSKATGFESSGCTDKPATSPDAETSMKADAAS